ncbi:MAG: hypothetical protein JJLCMIEE_02192 [Acidimicrobiales bacterium]|nr:MAG: class A beta-lactamase-related serine hydrolase [Actinomycetota bacterium]MBV6509124.1 hypothetical protein [Acidimicrobiales bacterium]RIK08524.1 MAG: serine hydrolase [Acidobacteriota bacterium]
MNPFDQIAAWPTLAVSAAVVSPRGVIARHGDQDRPYALASVTKLLTATAMLVAIQEETVGLDEPAGPPASTVRHLLAHASGLATDGSTVLAKPGTRRIYSNAGFEILGDHLAARAGMSFSEYLLEGVLEPLAMRATRLAGSPAHSGVSTVADLVRFAIELLRPTLLDEGILDLATNPVYRRLEGVLPGFGPQSPNSWGLGFEIRDDKHPHWTGSLNSPGTYGHFGRAGTFLWVDPRVELACICLTDREFGPWATRAWPALSDAVLNDLG